MHQITLNKLGHKNFKYFLKKTTIKKNCRSTYKIFIMQKKNENRKECEVYFNKQYEGLYN